MTLRWSVRAATGFASANCHANSVTEGLGSGHQKDSTAQCGEVRLRSLPKVELPFPFSIGQVLPDPCRGPSFLVSARKEAKKPTGEALNVALPRAKAALPGLLPART